jgi:AhpD family alkylhydroperoxidase
MIMEGINAIDAQAATGTGKTLLDGVQRKLGFLPNLMRTLAVSPAALDAYLSFSDRLSHGILSPKLREQLALTVAYSNSCQYCLAAHTRDRRNARPDALANRSCLHGRLHRSQDRRGAGLRVASGSEPGNPSLISTSASPQRSMH